MHPAAKKWAKFSVRWGIAVLGIWFVVKNISLHDTVRVRDPASGRPVVARLAGQSADGRAFTVYSADGSGGTRVVGRDQLVARSEYDRLKVRADAGPAQTVDVLGLVVPADDLPRTRWPLLVGEPRSVVARFLGRGDGPTWQVDPRQVVGSYNVDLSYPLVEDGLINVVRKADRAYLWAALLIFPLNYFITSFRWKLLLNALSIPIGAARAFQINMVGEFYNTFMPGSTGGDLVKAYYAAKQTTHRTRAVLSVVIDRVIGLLALVLLGGSVAAYRATASPDWSDPVARKCLQVAIGSAAIIGCTAVGLLVFYVPVLRRLTGLNFVLGRLPMQRHVRNAVEVMEIYGRRPWLMAGVLVGSLPVHAVSVVSGMLAGQAFGLPLRPGYYWVVVPVVTLAGAIPVSPQGAGVMEFFAYLLMRGQKATVADALVLTMSLRFVQVFWNLLAGIVVLRGGYHAPTETEARELEADGPVAARV